MSKLKHVKLYENFQMGGEKLMVGTFWDNGTRVDPGTITESEIMEVGGFRKYPSKSGLVDFTSHNLQFTAYQLVDSLQGMTLLMITLGGSCVAYAVSESVARSIESTLDGEEATSETMSILEGYPELMKAISFWGMDGCIISIQMNPEPNRIYKGEGDATTGSFDFQKSYPLHIDEYISDFN